MKRKSFIELASLGLISSAFVFALNSCRENISEKIKFIRSGANSSIGHLLRNDLPENIPISKELETDVFFPAQWDPKLGIHVT